MGKTFRVGRRIGQAGDDRRAAHGPVAVEYLQCQAIALHGEARELLAVLKKHFTTIKHAKPPASRKGSVEWYVVAQGFKGRPDAQD